MRETTIHSIYKKYLSETERFVEGKSGRARECVMQRAAFVNAMGKQGSLSLLAAVVGASNHTSALNMRRKHNFYVKFDGYTDMFDIASNLIDEAEKGDWIEYLKKEQQVLRDRFERITFEIEKLSDGFKEVG